MSLHQKERDIIIQNQYVDNFDFEEVYGDIGQNFIHVHHIKPLSEIDEKYWLDLIDSVYIMPLWIDKKSQTNQFLVKYCIDNNYNYCLRQHIILFWDGKWK